MKCPKCRLDNPETARFCLDCGTKFDASMPEQAPGHDSERATGPATGRSPAPTGRASFTKTLETATDELSRGMLFASRYEVIEELGQGGMGRVYRVHDTKLNEEVALKLIRPEFGADKRTVERFHNEIKLARKIRHKNVCGTHDLHEEGRTLYLTMEYVRGEDLKSFIKRSKVLSTGTSVAIAHQVAEGLAEAHKLGIVHRDLKPGNIMIDKEGQAKIMDFGIARAMREKGITGAGAIVGTPEYMSPEQVEGKEADQRADIYALGVILFEMVTGQTPFEGETPLSIAHKHRYEPPPDPRTLNPQIPIALSRVILRCMEKPLEKRYQTTGEFLADLEAIEASLPTTECAAGRAPSRTRPKTSREITVKFSLKKPVIVVGAVVVLAAAGFLIWRNIIHPPVPPVPSARPKLAILRFDNISKDQDLEVWVRGLPELLRSQLGQSRFLHVLDDATLVGILRQLGLNRAESFTADDLKRIAAKGGATHLLTGNYLPAGGKVILNLSLLDAEAGTALRPIQEEVPDQDAIANSVDALVKKVKSALDISEPEVEERVYKMVGDVYTRNPKALREYLTAQQLNEKSDFNGALAAMERAVAIDPEFAFAHLRLGSWYSNRGDYVKLYQASLKAYQLRNALPEIERLKIESWWLSLQEKDYPKAHALLHKIRETSPEDSWVWFRLAYTAEDPEEAIREYGNVIQYSRGLIPYSNLMRLYCSQGEYRKARELWQEALTIFPSQLWRYFHLGTLFILEGDLEAARGAYEMLAEKSADFDSKASPAWYYFATEDMDKARDVFETARRSDKDPSVADLWYVRYFMTKGRIREARALSDKLADKALTSAGGDTEKSQALIMVGKLFLQAGETSIALDKFRAALEYVDRQEDRIPGIALDNLVNIRRTALIWQACALCDMGKIAEAETLYRQLEDLIPEWRKRNKRDYGAQFFSVNSEIVATRIALANKNGREAVKSAQESFRVLRAQAPEETSNQAYVLDRLGEAYELAGDLEKAAQAYARIPGLFTGRMDWPVIYSRSYYKAGKVLEQMGNKAEARDKYQKFLSLWKDADPGLPEVEDAKKRLAGL